MVPSEIAPTVRHPEDESEINPIKQVGPIIPSGISVVFYSPIEILQPQANNPLNGQSSSPRGLIFGVYYIISTSRRFGLTAQCSPVE